MTNSLLQTLPVGSLVFSVLATDKDTGSAGVVQYYIEGVSATCPPPLLATRGSVSHREGWASSPPPHHPTSLIGPEA